MHSSDNGIHRHQEKIFSVAPAPDSCHSGSVLLWSLVERISPWKHRHLATRSCSILGALFPNQPFRLDNVNSVASQASL
jgi:hypothetical protein